MSRKDRERDEPLEGLAREIAARRERAEDRAVSDLFEDAFRSVDVEDVDVDTLWGQVFGVACETASGPPFPESGTRDVRVVSKRSYCQRCRYFSDPPAVACEHEGTDILAQVDSESFRVADCPIIAGRERIQRRSE